MDNICIDSLDEFREYIKNLDISLAHLEQLGIIFIVVGYLDFYDAANLDILEALEINNTGKHPDEEVLYGQFLILIGYILLWIVSVDRVNEKSSRNSNDNENFYIPAYVQVADSYLLSVLAHAMRLHTFYIIAETNKNEEIIE